MKAIILVLALMLNGYCIAGIRKSIRTGRILKELKPRVDEETINPDYASGVVDTVEKFIYF